MTAKKGGRWQKGQSGNPKGKPPGSGELQKLRASISEHVPEILDSLITAAKNGDVQSQRLLLERVLPPMKAIEQPVEIDMPADGSLTDKAQAVLSAMSSGNLPASQAAQLIAALGTFARLSSIDEMEERIQRLEEERNAKS